MTDRTASDDARCLRVSWVSPRERRAGHRDDGYGDGCHRSLFAIYDAWATATARGQVGSTGHHLSERGEDIRAIRARPIKLIEFHRQPAFSPWLKSVVDSFNTTVQTNVSNRVFKLISHDVTSQLDAIWDGHGGMTVLAW